MGIDEVYMKFAAFKKGKVEIDDLEKFVINFIYEKEGKDFLRGYNNGKEEILSKMKRILKEEEA